MLVDSVRIQDFYDRQTRWRDELLFLRNILLTEGLTEEFKWRGPCYTHLGGNVALAQGFNDGCVLSFFKGVMLDDPEGHLEFAGEHSRIVKLLRFQSLEEISQAIDIARGFIRQAMAFEVKGLKVEVAPAEFQVPPDIAEVLAADAVLSAAWAALTPGRQRSWVLNFSQAIQSVTRLARLEKARDKILAGKGMNDR